MCASLERKYKEKEQDGERRGEKRGQQNARVLDIKNLMKNLQLTLGQAMDALSIPTDQRATLAGMVNSK